MQWKVEREEQMRWLVLSNLHLDFKNCTTSTAREALIHTLKSERKEHGEFNALNYAVTGRFYKHFDVNEIGNFRIITINSTLLSKDAADIGNLGVCFQELDDLGKRIEEDDKFNIAIMHHSVDC